LTICAPAETLSPSGPQLCGAEEPLEGLRTSQAFFAANEPNAHCQAVLAAQGAVSKNHIQQISANVAQGF